MKYYEWLITLTGVVASSAGTFFLGMQYEDRLSSVDRMAAQSLHDQDISAAYQRGYDEAGKEARAKEEQGALIAELSAKMLNVLRSPAADSLPKSYSQDMTLALEAARTGDLRRAIELAPSGIEYIAPEECVAQNEWFEIKPDMYFEVCDKPIEVFVKEIDPKTKSITLLLNGASSSQGHLGQAAGLGDGCKLLNRESNSGGDQIANIVRIECQG